jgi:hypothetical protein
MTSMRRTGALLCAVALSALGCGGEGSAGERRDIVETMKAGRDALVAGRAAEACALLTPHGRKQSIEFPSIYDRARDCEHVVRLMLKDARLAARTGDEPWVDRARGAEFEVTEIDGSEATVQVDVGAGETFSVELRRIDAGWRIDDSDNVPHGD